MIKKRTTIYLDEKLIKMLKFRSISSGQSISEYISNVAYQDLLEEKQDLENIKNIVNEPTVPYEKVLKMLDLENEI